MIRSESSESECAKRQENAQEVCWEVVPRMQEITGRASRSQTWDSKKLQAIEKMQIREYELITRDGHLSSQMGAGRAPLPRAPEFRVPSRERGEAAGVRR